MKLATRRLNETNPSSTESPWAPVRRKWAPLGRRVWVLCPLKARVRAGSSWKVMSSEPLGGKLCLQARVHLETWCKRLQLTPRSLCWFSPQPCWHATLLPADTVPASCRRPGAARTVDTVPASPRGPGAAQFNLRACREWGHSRIRTYTSIFSFFSSLRCLNINLIISLNPRAPGIVVGIELVHRRYFLRFIFTLHWAKVYELCSFLK